MVLNSKFKDQDQDQSFLVACDVRQIGEIAANVQYITIHALISDLMNAPKTIVNVHAHAMTSIPPSFLSFCQRRLLEKIMCIPATSTAIEIQPRTIIYATPSGLPWTKFVFFINATSI